MVSFRLSRTDLATTYSGSDISGVIVDNYPGTCVFFDVWHHKGIHVAAVYVRAEHSIARQDPQEEG
jgi:hypothetical protein